MSQQTPSADQIFQRALASYQAGRFREAAVDCRQVLALHPDHAPTWNLLGAILCAAHEFPGAIDAFQQSPFQHIGILSLEFHVDKLSRPLL